MRPKPSRRRRNIRRSGDRFRLLITFPGQDRPRRLSTSNLPAARRIARRSARSDDAIVAFQTWRRYGRYSTTRTYSSNPT